MHPYDWAMYDDPDDDEDEFGDDEFSDEDAYLFPPDEYEGLFPVVERIREYVMTDYTRYTPDVVREVEAVQAYIESGITQFEALLQRHAEFDAWLAERGESVA